MKSETRNPHRPFRTLRGALANSAPELPILRIGSGKQALYIALGETDMIGARLTEIALIAPTGHITGFVGLGHLDRLGNANWATPRAEATTGRNKPVRIWPEFCTPPNKAKPDAI